MRIKKTAQLMKNQGRCSDISMIYLSLKQSALVYIFHRSEMEKKRVRKEKMLLS